MRPATYLASFYAVLVFLVVVQVIHFNVNQGLNRANLRTLTKLTSLIGYGDVSLSTEARYTRHLSLTDMVVPFMDHPGSMEHFPSGSLLVPPSLNEK